MSKRKEINDYWDYWHYVWGWLFHYHGVLTLLMMPTRCQFANMSYEEPLTNFESTEGKEHPHTKEHVSQHNLQHA